MPMILLTSKDNRGYWIWISKFLFGYPTSGLDNDPQHIAKKLPKCSEISHSPSGLREPRRKLRTEEERSGYWRAASFMTHNRHPVWGWEVRNRKWLLNDSQPRQCFPTSFYHSVLLCNVVRCDGFMHKATFISSEAALPVVQLVLLPSCTAFLNTNVAFTVLPFKSKTCCLHLLPFKSKTWLCHNSLQDSQII